MKILFLPKYTALGASSRMRTYQYLPYYRAAGIDCTVKPLFDDAYLNNLYAGKRNILNVLSSYCKRIGVCFTFYRYDKIYVEKEFFPYLPAFTVWLMVIFKKKYVVDYDDAIFHNYDQSSNFFVKMFLGQKIDQVMKHAEVVIAGNSYLAKRAMEAGAKKVVVIPTVIDLERYSIQEKSKEQFIIGWIGTKTTFEKHLLPQKKWIKALQKGIPDIQFHIVGITEDMDLGKNVKYIPWSEASEVSEIQKFDVGIMPLQDSLWENGKCSYKIIQYFACGIPAIASPVGMNTEVIIPQHNGFLARTENDWFAAILELKSNKERSKSFGKNGRKMVEEHFCMQVTAKKWLDVLLNANSNH